MSRSLLISVVVPLVLSLSVTGCSLMEDDSPGANGDASAASGAIKTKNELLQQSKEWWDEATSLAPDSVDSAIVTCRLDGSTQFMSKDDCLTRGGIPKGVSG